MNPLAQSRVARRSRFGGLAVVALGLVAAAGTVVAILWALGAVDPAKLLSRRRSTTGMIAVPIAARTIHAYAKITQADLLDPQTGDFAMLYFRPDRIDNNVITHLADIWGRVLNHEKPAGFDFTEN